jgi:hypothetical protein
MSRIITITTEEGRTTSCEFKQIRGISQSFVFFDMEHPDDVDYWRSFFEDYAVKITQHLLQYAVQISLRVSCNGQYEQHDTGVLSEPIVMNSAHPARINRHANHERKIQNQFLAVHDPNEYYMRLQEQFGSNIGTLEVYHSFSMTFEFPFEYNARALPASYRLHKCELTDFLSYNPRNTDPYCVLHCLFAGQEQLHAGKSLNRNVAYMESFSQWFQDHNLSRFYIDGYFVLDNVEKLEKELGVNINFYTFEDKLELFYRSSYLQEGEIFNMVVIPMKYFTTTATPKVRLLKLQPKLRSWYCPSPTSMKNLLPTSTSKTWSPNVMDIVLYSTLGSFATGRRMDVYNTIQTFVVTALGILLHTRLKITKQFAKQPLAKPNAHYVFVTTKNSNQSKLPKSLLLTMRNTKFLSAFTTLKPVSMLKVVMFHLATQ